jgi:hypothetical protein
MEDYYASWYNKKKADVCAKKREQYQNDPELRERKRALALARYYRLKTESLPLKKLSPI